MTPDPLSSPAAVLRAARDIGASVDSRALRVLILATFDARLLEPYVVVAGAEIGAPIAISSGPFGQLEQLAMDATHSLWNARPDVVVVALRALDVAADLLSAPRAERAGRVAVLMERVIGICRSIRAHSSASIVAFNFAIDRCGLDPFDASDPDGVTHLLADANRGLARALADIGDAHVLDYGGVVARGGGASFVDPKLWASAKTASGFQGQVILARALARAARAVRRPAHKCVVVDLDNTLWGGVIGDDGLEGLVLGDDPAGSLFKSFQLALRGLITRGFMLALASKNDPAIAKDAIDRHPEMLLRTRDFASVRISWGPKPQALREIADELNIGLDALVFFDDNPAERAAVQAELPMVHVVDVPQDPARFVETLAAVPGLERPRLLAEDARRASIVGEENERRAFATSAKSIGEFLRELQMVADVANVDALSLERVHQLVQKTNQFNLTTRRHSQADLQRLSAAPDACVRTLRLSDRFGALGLVGVGILRLIEPGLAEIDTFLMSCRVMGRCVEDAMLADLFEEARRLGAKKVRGIFAPTPRNAPVRSFYDERGFTLVADSDGGRVYEAMTDAGRPWPEALARQPTDPT